MRDVPQFGAGGGPSGRIFAWSSESASKAAIGPDENGGGGMPPFKDAFTQNEIQQIVDFIDGLRRAQAAV